MPSRLLEPLSEDQQLLIEVVAEAYPSTDDWPIFDYVEAKFDRVRKDAWETLYSLPREGGWQYGPAWWVGLNQPQLKPSPDTKIELTVVGMHHSEVFNDSVEIFLLTLRFMIERYRRAPASPLKPRNLEITAFDRSEFLRGERRGPLMEWTLDHLPTLWRREPATWGGGESRDAEGIWSKTVPRTVLDYEGVTTIDEYVDRLVALTAVPRNLAATRTPSPLSLVAALDYLDMAWRVVHNQPLFIYPSAERAARLTQPAVTPADFDSHLTALGEILRSANATVRQLHPGKPPKQTFDEPLAPLRDLLLTQDPTKGAAGLSDAVSVLEAALSVRDAAQHTEAGGRAITALVSTLGIEHPILDHSVAWDAVSTQVVHALNVIREATIAST